MGGKNPEIRQLCQTGVGKQNKVNPEIGLLLQAVYLKGCEGDSEAHVFVFVFLLLFPESDV